MTTEAKRLAALEKVLIGKFREAQKREHESHSKLIKENRLLLPSTVSVVPAALPPPPALQPPLSKLAKSGKNLTVSKAKQLENLSKRLQNDFIEVHRQGIEEQLQRERKYEPITRAIKEQDTAEKLSKELLRKQKINQLISRYRPRPEVSSTPERKYSEEDKTDELATQNQSMKQLMDTNVINLGTVGTMYLPRANDSQFGIYYDETDNRLKIGDQPISFDYDDILLPQSRSKYGGTEGLWKLLTSKVLVEPEAYTKEDWYKYKDILLKTNTIFQKNDPASKRPKASQGQKWKKMIKPVWDEMTKPTVTENPVEEDVTTVGSGLYNGRQVEYKYIKNLNDLVNRLNYIHAQEEAGNNNFHNEKLSVVKFIRDRMEELVERPNGIKYLVRCLSALPERVIEGSGILNDMLNKLPFELHAPGYNFCGPGTRLDERLRRGDRGVNPLDEECRKHDMWYRDHTRAEDRWVADKKLQEAAWQRVISPDADLNERAVGLTTAGTMWLKRKLGMGLTGTGLSGTVCM